jgi:phosphoglycolate phosphatase-like HAD superfamily hydrolase
VTDEGAADTPRLVVSFDIDGTLETGDPRGPLLIEVVRAAQSLGYIVGSSSDRTLGEQQAMWDKAGLSVDFTRRNHQMHDLIDRYPADRYIHIGDTAYDLECAHRAGFDFIWIESAALVPDAPWTADHVSLRAA